MSRPTAASEDESIDEAPAPTTRWRWLDGPADLDRPGADAVRFAAALATQVRAPLSYGNWSCVLQWRDEHGDGGSDEAPTTRRYELSFWVDGEPPQPGSQLGPPGEFVASATLAADPAAAARAMRDAVLGLLAEAERTLEARAAAKPAQATRGAGAAMRAAPTPSRVDGARVASPSSRGSSRSRARRTIRRTALELAVAAVAVVAGLYALQAFVLKPYVVPSSSMAATLVRGQHVLVDRLIYRLRPVERGDIIVFRRPGPPDDVLIKRVVGVPGDVLSLRAGRLYVNGLPADVAFVDRVHGVVEPTLPADPLAPGDPNGPWTLARPYRVPPGRYFVLGDDRTDSIDSRSWGTVPRSAIIGQAFLSFWPPDRIHAF